MVYDACLPKKVVARDLANGGTASEAQRWDSSRSVRSFSGGSPSIINNKKVAA